MTITILHHNEPDGSLGKVEVVDHLSFKELQKVVGGYVQTVMLKTDIGAVDVCMNEEGLIEGLPKNTIATDLYKDRISISPTHGAVGNWVILSGKDRLR